MTDKEQFKQLSYERKCVYEVISENEKKDMFTLCEEYKDFLNKGKTERECVAQSVKAAENAGFVKLENKSSLSAGDKIYTVNRDKNIMLAVIGTDDITNGFNLVGAHIDSPRLDLKQNPLYESDGLALFKTHYYGGIKKYQWPAMPLALHGVICKKDGSCINVCIGEGVTDLLPHLGKDQMSKKMTDGIEGEALNILVGGMGIGDSDVSEKVKYNILKILNEKYGITETDFLSAEIEAVHAHLTGA